MDDQQLRDAGVALTYTVRTLARGARTWEITVSAPPGSDTAARSALESAATYLDALCDVEAPDDPEATHDEPRAQSSAVADIRAELLKRLGRGIGDPKRLVRDLPRSRASAELQALLQEQIVRVDENGQYAKR